jgi:beta-galactosidase
MRAHYPFNQNWLYVPQDLALNAPDSDFTAVTLPHSNKIVPHHNFDVREYAFISTYRKRFSLPEAVNGRRVWLAFEAVMLASQVWINGHSLGEYDGGFTPFAYDITDYLREGENIVQVRVDSTERPDIPPFGYIVDYLTFGGIYREVALDYLPQPHIADVFVRTYDVLTPTPRAEVDVLIKSRLLSSAPLTLTVAIHDAQGAVVAHREAPVTLSDSGETHLTVAFDDLPPVTLWSLENPVRYSLHTALSSSGQVIDDNGAFAFGFREAVFRPDGFTLNGEKVKLRGVNRHQIYPYIGAAAPARLQRKDADICKYELSVNIVRTSHYPQSRHFLDRCDEIGLLVFEEIPGWQNIGDSDWKGISLRDVEAMILRDRNHPSIIIWGVRINESWDDEAFYTATNALAHKLDPTRQTGGVRYFQESQFLEDVFTLNDFSNAIVEPLNQPHLVTEFLGHMYPTKTYDQEERQVEHALRHARIQNQAAGMGNVTGAIAWCMFDYNTHVEFGSGDRICYHGVMDMWRLPKFAAHFYESQIEPATRIVLQAATFYAFGDKSNGGGDNDFDYIVFSNCDEIEVFLDDTSLAGRITPARDRYPHLAHPPFYIGDGQMWYTHRLRVPDARIVGYINGQAVAETRLSADKLPVALTLTPDDAELHADGADMTRLVFKLVDPYGHRLPHAHAVVSFSIEGEAELIGVNPFPLVGGQAAMYVKAKHSAGRVVVRASAHPFGLTAEAVITIRA